MVERFPDDKQVDLTYDGVTMTICDAGDISGTDTADRDYHVRRNEIWYTGNPVATANVEKRLGREEYILEWGSDIDRRPFFDLVKNDENLGVNPDIEAFDDDVDLDITAFDEETGNAEVENYPERGTFYEFFYERDDIDRFDSIGFRNGHQDKEFYYIDWANWGFNGNNDLDEVRIVTTNTNLEDILGHYIEPTTENLYSSREQNALKKAMLDGLEQEF